MANGFAQSKLTTPSTACPSRPSWKPGRPKFQPISSSSSKLCIAEAENDLEIPFVSTADWGYLRLRRPDYGDPELKTWAERIRQQNWRDAFIFFKHEEEGKGPQMAKRFIELSKT